jgi:nicotinamidase-related amidase
MPKNLLLLAICVATAFSCYSASVKKPRSVLEDTGVLIIDVQKLFIPGEAAYFPRYSPPEDVTPVLDNLERMIVQADQLALPLFLTFELSDDGNSALVDRLSLALPPEKPQTFVKSFFNATAHPEFAQMIRDSGVKRLVVGGAETDVCVLQTVLGLLEMGIEVYLVRDSVLTNEFNYEPALLRMEQAGAKLMFFEDFQKSVVENRVVTVDPHFIVRRSDVPAPVPIKPGRIAFVMMDVVKETFNQAHQSEAAILQRLQQAWFASFVFDVPFFLSRDPSLDNGLPDGFSPVGGEVSSFEKTTGSAADVTELVDMLQERAIEQVVVLGVGQDGSVHITAEDFAATGFQTFVMEDATVSRGGRSQTEQIRQAAYQSGVIPLTYKSFYYGMTKAADRSDWPSPEWMGRLEALSKQDVGLSGPTTSFP